MDWLFSIEAPWLSVVLVAPFVLWMLGTEDQQFKNAHIQKIEDEANAQH